MAEVVTGEAVVLDVPCARFPSRTAAIAIDMAIQFALVIIFLLVMASARAGGALDAASGTALSLTVMVLVLVGYPVVWETVTRGASPGKLALGLRVVSDDGSPERFRQALVRGLAAAVEIWGLFGAPALIASLFSARGKRLGDLFAGTFVIQQRLPANRARTAVTVPPHLAGWAASLEMSGLSDQTAEQARQYLARVGELRPDARARLGAQFATAVSGQVTPLPPPGVPAEVYLCAVLAERRRREDARQQVGPAAVDEATGLAANAAVLPPAAGSEVPATSGSDAPSAPGSDALRAPESGPSAASGSGPRVETSQGQTPRAAAGSPPAGPPPAGTGFVPPA